jgi:hypothetical protein
MSVVGMGKWLLPQPPKGKEYIPIPILVQSKLTCPFGYELKEEDPTMFFPIPKELEALEKAKKHLKQYSYKEVAAWLSTQTGRYISPMGLHTRINNEQKHGRKNSTYRLLADRYEEALKKAAHYEKRCGSTTDNNFFSSERYRAIKSTFINGDS